MKFIHCFRKNFVWRLGEIDPKTGECTETNKVTPMAEIVLGLNSGTYARDPDDLGKVVRQNAYETVRFYEDIESISILILNLENTRKALIDMLRAFPGVDVVADDAEVEATCEGDPEEVVE